MPSTPAPSLPPSVPPPMAPREPGPDITAFYANGSLSDAVYGPGDNLTLRFSAPTDRAPALWAQGVPGSLPHAAVSTLLSCHVNVGGEARAVPRTRTRTPSRTLTLTLTATPTLTPTKARAVSLGAVEGAWVADDVLRLNVMSTDGAAPGPTLTLTLTLTPNPNPNT